MLAIGRNSDYASRVVLHLASLEPGARVTTGEIAALRLIPPAFVRRIVSRLSAAGILRTSRGVGGGISLARPAAEISLGDVVQAVEGPVALNVCVSEPKACPLSDACPVSRAWVGVTEDLIRSLDAVRFDVLAAGLDGAGELGGTGRGKRR